MNSKSQVEVGEEAIAKYPSDGPKSIFGIDTSNPTPPSKPNKVDPLESN